MMSTQVLQTMRTTWSFEMLQIYGRYEALAVERYGVMEGMV